jgi:hypothetical protein
MNSLPPDIPVCDRIPLIMVETVAASSQRIAPREAQSSTIPMIRLGPRKLLHVMKHISGIEGRFLAMETGLYAMTLTPPRAVKRAAGSRLAGLLVAQPDRKPTGELAQVSHDGT